MVRLILFIFIFIFPSELLGKKLSTQEKIIFNFIDADRDDRLSMKELDQILILVFQLLDKNMDGNISEIEIIELKKIINSLI